MYEIPHIQYIPTHGYVRFFLPKYNPPPPPTTTSTTTSTTTMDSMIQMTTVSSSSDKMNKNRKKEDKDGVLLENQIIPTFNSTPSTISNYYNNNYPWTPTNTTNIYT